MQTSPKLHFKVAFQIAFQLSVQLVVSGVVVVAIVAVVIVAVANAVSTVVVVVVVVIGVVLQIRVTNLQFNFLRIGCLQNHNRHNQHFKFASLLGVCKSRCAWCSVDSSLV